MAAVREECLKAKAVDRDAAHARIRRERYAREFTDGEGAWNFVARGTPEDGARFRDAHEPIVDEMFKAARTEDQQGEPGRVRVRRVHRDGPPRQRARDATPRRRSRRPRFMGLIRADIEALRRGTVEGDEICEIAGLGPIPVTVARELLGDAVLKLVITKGVDVANVTHLGRSATVAQQVALWWQSPMCTSDGLHAHPAARERPPSSTGTKTKHTRLDEIDPLCEHDHDLKTYHGWALVDGTGKRPMVPPDDPRHPKYRAPPDP